MIYNYKLKKKINVTVYHKYKQMFYSFSFRPTPMNLKFASKIGRANEI